MSVKTVSVNSDEGWTLLTGDYSQKSIDHLYSTISWLYRCVTIRGNSVSAMPFEVRKGEQVVYEYDGITPQTSIPTEIEWIRQLPQLLGLVEVANCLGGRAYIERQKNLLRRRDLSLKWLLPWSIVPIYNGVANEFGTERDSEKSVGTLLGFWRKMTEYQFQPTRFEVEDVGYFWLPDYATEIGPARNYPGKAVLQNAGVIGALDIFLHGYFERGLIKATLLKYKEPLQQNEAGRVKEWWKRVFAGVGNAHAAEVVRGDFETITIGDGIDSLRDNTLTKDEKDSIAVGMGVPPSKLLPVGVNRATKDGDDRSYIEDTIIPEIVWIYRVVNNQFLNPLGYSIVALPQQLRVMQADEVERSQAFSNYRNGGYTVDEVENILGIYVAEDVKEAANQQRLENRERFLQNSPQSGSQNEDDDENEKKLLDLLDLLDKRDEKAQFERWLKNRNGDFDVNDFDSQYLTYNEKIKIAYKSRRNDSIPSLNGNNDIESNDSDIDEAIRRFNRLFPDKKDLLNAAVVENA